MATTFLTYLNSAKWLLIVFELFKVSKQLCKTQSFMCRLKHKRVDLKPTEEKV